ncbi:MAG: hypothetical protein Q8N53_18820 [Longimicrobiales bacterium]|nr:hypothetical protein [Longimicrobiales bacterium]
MKAVSRTARALDLVGLLLFLAGAGFFAWAWAGFREVPAFVPDPAGERWAAVRLADGYLRLQWIGGALMTAGVATFVAAWWVARRAPV